MHQENKRDWCQFLTRNCLYIVEVESNHIMHQETKRDWCKYLTKDHLRIAEVYVSRKQGCELKNQSGCGSAHAIMIAASHACSCEPTVKQTAPQVIILLTLLTLLTQPLTVPLAWKFYAA